MSAWDVAGLILILLIFIGWGVHEYYDVYLPDLKEKDTK